jgi:hypothetical protein
VPALGADNARCDRLPKTEGVADRHHPFADLCGIGISEFEHREVCASLDLEKRQIGFRIAANDLRIVRLVAPQELDLDLVSFGHNVVVCNDIAVI